MASAVYQRLARAIENRTPVVCHYNGYRREICPTVLGHTDGVETDLVWQMAGETSNGSLKRAEWKCFQLGKAHNVHMFEGEWKTGTSHQQAQTCVKDVDYDANPNSPYNPTRSLGDLRWKD